MTHEPVCDDFNDRFESIDEWLDSILIYSEEQGRERGYFDAASPYAKTYHRKLTARQAKFREAYRPLAHSQTAEEKSWGADVSEEEDFGL